MGDENREDLIKQILIQRRTNDESQEQIKVKISENNKLKQDLYTTEQEEEHITNQLLKRLADKKKETELLLVEVEKEEEYLTNNLQFKLRELRKEKEELENQLEKEEEFLTFRLQKQLNALISKKEDLEARLVSQNPEIIELENLQTELAQLTVKLSEIQKKQNQNKTKNNRLRMQIKKLKNDNFTLKQKINSGKEELDELKNQKIRLVSDIEKLSEQDFNINANSNTFQKRARSTSLPVKNSQIKSSIPVNQNSDLNLSPIHPSSSTLDSKITSKIRGSCIKSGTMKFLLRDKVWISHWVMLYDSGELLCCNNEDGNAFIINLDTVISVEDFSNHPIPLLNHKYPSTIHIKCNSNENFYFQCEKKEFDEWFKLIDDLSPAIINKSS